jgi:hypothetical protein
VPHSQAICPQCFGCEGFPEDLTTMEKSIRTIALMSVIGFGPTLFLSAPAWADTTPPDTSAIDALVEDISAHKQLCATVTPSQAGLYKQCSNEQASLAARQKALGLTDEALNGNPKLKSRGWRWP